MNHGGEFQEREQSNSEMTKYPHIFSCTYWGGFKKSSLNSDTEITENRNAFVEQFMLEERGVKVYSEIKNRSLRRKVLMKYFHDYEGVFTDFDHKEVYMINADEYVIIFSPYSATDETDIQLETLGWSRYKELYGKGVRTYILHLTMGKINKLKQSWIGCH